MLPMKRILIVILPLSLLLSGCKKPPAPVFTMEYPFNYEVPGGLSTFKRYSKVFRVASSLDAALQSSNISRDQVTEVLSHDMWLETADGSVYDFGRFSEINVYISDTNDPNKRIEIAYVQPVVNEKGRLIRLIPGTANVLKYMKEPFFNIEIVLTLRNISVYSQQHMFLKFAGLTEG